MSRTSSVIAMAKTPSLKASSRPLLNPRRLRLGGDSALVTARL